MKKMLLCCLLLLSSVARAQFVVSDPLANKKLSSQLLKWIQDYAKQTGQKINLDKILAENKTTTEKITALLDLKRQIEEGLYSVNDFQKLRISDLSRILEEVYGLGTLPEYGQGLPFLEDYHRLAGGPPSVERANELYRYFRGGTSAYEPEKGGRLDNYLALSKEQKAKAYALTVAVQKRKMAAAQAYGRLAGQLLELAADLSGQINREGEHRMSTGERIKAQKQANDYSVKSIELKAKADQLMREALSPSALQQEIDGSRQHSLNRSAMGKISIE